MTIRPDQSVDEVMRQWPVTIRVFLDHRMRCVGCSVAPFHGVAFACLEHGVNESRFLAALEAAVTP